MNPRAGKRAAGIWARKSVDAPAAEPAGPRLQRTLGVVDLVAFGVGCTVGAGIFSLTGEVAAHQAGPAVSLSFILAAIACFFAGLCYAEFAAMVPISGSAYSYSYATLGEIVAWVIGWSLILEWLFSVSVVAISWSGYVSSALAELGITLPIQLAHAPLGVDEHNHVVATGGWIDLPAVAVVLGCTALATLSTKTSSLVNTAIVIVKLAALAALVVVGAAFVRTNNWHPFVPPNSGEFGSFGWSGVFRGAGILFFAFIGFDGVSALAEDARNPQRTVPLSLFVSLVIVTLVYVSVSVVVTGLTSYGSLAVPDPLYTALSAPGSPTGLLRAVRALIAVVAVVGLVSVVLANIIGQVRIFFAMARDGLLPAALSRLSPRTNTPVAATLLTGGLAAALAGMFPLGLLGELVSIGTLLAFAIVCGGVMILRRIAPAAHRPFRTPWVPFIPIAGVISCTVLMLSLPASTWIRMVVWTALGLLVYAFYGRRHSKLRAGAESNIKG
jgi:basic amino acid/polyamine antiporter, APA family